MPARSRWFGRLGMPERSHPQQISWGSAGQERRGGSAEGSAGWERPGAPTGSEATPLPPPCRPITPGTAMARRTAIRRAAPAADQNRNLPLCLGLELFSQVWRLIVLTIDIKSRRQYTFYRYRSRWCVVFRMWNPVWAGFVRQRGSGHGSCPFRTCTPPPR